MLMSYDDLWLCSIIGDDDDVDDDDDDDDDCYSRDEILSSTCSSRMDAT